MQQIRQIMLDTETTGLEPSQGHRIIEIGCVELVNRKFTGRHFHCYINPQRSVDEGAFKVHGLGNEFLADKPLFKAIADLFIDFITGAELIIHNAPFDVGFINHEFNLLKNNLKPVAEYSKITDSLVMARKLHPGQRNSLDALCKRYNINNSHRELHGALLDAEILAHVYLAMTGGQQKLFSADANSEQANTDQQSAQAINHAVQHNVPVINATTAELELHQQYLGKMAAKRGEPTVWQQLQTTEKE